MNFCDYFFFSKDPFGETPDTKFFFAASKHLFALENIHSSITQGRGFSLLIGEVGMGKTILSRILASKLQTEAEIALILNPLLGGADLLREICQEFGHLSCEGLNDRQCLNYLNSVLLDNKKRNKKSVLIIDEAQILSRNSLELVRLLTNLETESQKLLQIILIGQPELKETLAQPDLRQLKQRIYRCCSLGPMCAAETAAYIRHRISCAGGENFIRFDDKALTLIHEFTRGIPRPINKICDILLQHAKAEEIRLIDYAFVKNILGVGSMELKVKRKFPRIWGSL